MSGPRFWGSKGAGRFAFSEFFGVTRHMARKPSEDEMVDENEGSAAVAVEGDGDEAADEPLNLDVQVTSPGACERHVTVTIAREDIDRYFDDAFGEMMPTAAVPGFRIGRAPRKIVEHRFRDEVSDQVKSALLLDSLEQISEEQRFTAISEPDFDLEAVEVPKEGPMTFEFTIEVRPEFDMPQWKGLKLNRPVREFTDADVDAQLEQMLSRYGQLAPFEGEASEGDYLSVNFTSSYEGKQLRARMKPWCEFVRRSASAMPSSKASPS